MQIFVSTFTTFSLRTGFSGISGENSLIVYKKFPTNV
jgi:hypothetical protein